MGDTHFDHANIIKYCQRPFADVKAMNDAILANLKVIAPDDIFYFMGDLNMGKGSRVWWLSQLPGKVTFIKGSHDRGIHPPEFNGIKVLYSQIVAVDGLLFRLIHDPNQMTNWDGWTIHAHVHNTAPFINRELKRVNVAVEATDYKPINLATISQSEVANV